MKKILRFIPPFIGLILFFVALGILHRELRNYHYRDVIQYLREIPLPAVFVAVLLMVIAHFNYTLYDTLACRYLGINLPYSKTGLAGFLVYAISNNTGMAGLGGSTIRYRFYTSWNISPLDIAKIVLFCGWSLWLGLLILCGTIFLVLPPAIPGQFRIPFSTVRPLGFIALAPVLAYLFMVFIRKNPVRIRGWEMPIPKPKFLLAQILIGTMDWILGCAVLYSLMPLDRPLHFPAFLGLFLLGNIAGIISQIPGGLGVFETVIILGMGKAVTLDKVLGSLLLYRGIYYLLPLVVASLFIGLHEWREHRKHLKELGLALSRWAPAVVPHVLAFSTFVAGAILLFSGATPSIKGRLEILDRFLPLPILEASHFLNSLAGVGLLLLARSLQRRLDAAFYLTILLLSGGIVFSIFKGFDYEEAIILFLMLASLLPCRHYFFRRSSLLSQPFSPGWFMAVLIVLACSIWLGLFTHKHVNFSSDLWWRFTLLGNAPRFMRATVGAVCLALIFSLVRLLRYPRYIAPHTAEEDLERAKPIIASFPETYPYLALLGDKSFLFSESGNAFLMFGVKDRSWVAFKDPVGPREEYDELLWNFREMCDRNSGWPVFYEISHRFMECYIDQGLTLLKIGEEGYVPLDDFSLEGSKHKDLRQACNHLAREGFSFELVPPEKVHGMIEELRRISDEWLASKNTHEKGFSLGFFHEDYLKALPVGIVRWREKVIAFANILATSAREELSIDLMRYRSDVPHGVMDFLFAQIMIWGKAEKYKRFNLGMAPFAGLETRALAPVWNRLAGYLYRHGEHFYNFQGLRKYKDKFDPEWEGRYLAYPGGFALPRILVNIASLISGSLAKIVMK